MLLILYVPSENVCFWTAILRTNLSPGDPWHLVENQFVETTFGRMRHLVDTTFRRLRRLADYDNWSKISRITSKFSRNLVENWFVPKK